MAKTIKVEWTPEDVAGIVHEWMGEAISKKEAERIIAKIKAQAEEEIGTAAWPIIAKLVETL